MIHEVIHTRGGVRRVGGCLHHCCCVLASFMTSEFKLWNAKREIWGLYIPPPPLPSPRLTHTHTHKVKGTETCKSQTMASSHWLLASHTAHTQGVAVVMEADAGILTGKAPNTTPPPTHPHPSTLYTWLRWGIRENIKPCVSLRVVYSVRYGATCGDWNREALTILNHKTVIRRNDSPEEEEERKKKRSSRCWWKMRSGAIYATEERSDAALRGRSHLLLIQALMYIMYKLVEGGPSCAVHCCGNKL